mgnify:CR=1 FL=1
MISPGKRAFLRAEKSPAMQGWGKRRWDSGAVLALAVLALEGVENEELPGTSQAAPRLNQSVMAS